VNIATVHEKKRGCGYRQPGGLYLRTDGLGRECGALPIETTVCPTCHHGIKQARGWTWINLAELASVRGCPLNEIVATVEGEPDGCGNCPIADAMIQMAGLIWIGEKFYPTPGHFSREAVAMGVSRRLPGRHIPRDFRLGETWVCLAHPKAIPVPMAVITEGGEIGRVQFKPGIFHVFRPSRIEYCVKEGDTDEALEAMEKRGITLVKVVPVQEEPEEPELHLV
jgi:hypothetical protein